ncbi:MAG: bile acid:sodium symporter family protein [Bacteroidales bacterium]
MKIIELIERYFWLFLIAGLVLGIAWPVYNDFLMALLKPLLMMMLFLVFLKTDMTGIIRQIKDYKLMTYLVFMYMLVIPSVFFLVINLFNRELAIGILLLTAMPAAVASSTLTDIIRGNTALSLSITVITSMIAPFTVPLLFGFINYDDLSIDTLLMFKDLAMLIFLPLTISRILKRFFQDTIDKVKVTFTSFNVFLLFIMIYAAMGSQRDIILDQPLVIIWQTLFLYLIFVLLHIIGYVMGYRQDKESRKAIAVGAAYMNNGMAIVLAAIHFEPSILVLMILSEFPWSTLLAPFRRIVN